MARDDTVLFIGSGLSVWSGLPTWTSLIELLRDELLRLGRVSDLVERELQQGDLLLAASYGFDQLNSQEQRSFLRSVIAGDAQPSEAHELLAKLGPSCFITTNYDALVERALFEHRRGEHFDVVTPAHPLEIPSIIRARADHFVFKPHGDISNAESVVLTRESYRRLQSENRAVFEAVRALLASRPVVYVGFGLRDPDFILMRDMLFSTFGSNPSDHFAIMPGVHAEERAYWNRNYGIDLVSYPLDAEAPPNQRHARLLDLLRDLGGVTQSIPPQTMNDQVATLTMARYARGTLAAIPIVGEADFPLTLQQAITSYSPSHSAPRLNGEAVATLSEFRGHLVIEGPPGGGKSYTVRKLTRYLANALESACLGKDVPELSTLRVPVLVPMRDYRGDIIELLESALPNDISANWLLSNTSAVVILDGLNEAPEFGGDEERQVSAQIAKLLAAAGGATVLITTRFAGQLASLKLPIVTIDAVGKRWLVSHHIMKEARG